MAGYLIRVNYKVAGVSKFAMYGIEDGQFPDQTTAINHSITHVTDYRTAHGETVTNVTALVSAIR